MVLLAGGEAAHSPTMCGELAEWMKCGTHKSCAPIDCTEPGKLADQKVETQATKGLLCEEGAPAEVHESAKGENSLLDKMKCCLATHSLEPIKGSEAKIEGYPKEKEEATLPAEVAAPDGTDYKHVKHEEPPMARIPRMGPISVLRVLGNKELYDDIALISAACKHLRQLCNKRNARMVCDRLNASFILCSVMAKHVYLPDLQIDACAILAKLCSGKKADTLNRVADSGAIILIIRAMRVHVNCASIQDLALSSILSIISGRDRHSKKRKQQLIDAGVFQAIAQALAPLKGKAPLQKKGIATLRKLCQKSKRLREAAILAGANAAWFAKSK